MKPCDLFIEFHWVNSQSFMAVFRVEIDHGGVSFLDISSTTISHSVLSFCPCTPRALGPSCPFDAGDSKSGNNEKRVDLPRARRLSAIPWLK
jgi:hypothetical protein